MSRPVVYSASSLQAYQDCSLQWYFQYVAVLPAIPSYEMANGIAVHAAAESVLRAKLVTVELAPSHPDFVDAADQVAREALAAYRFAMADSPYLPDAAGEAQVGVFLRDIAPGVEPMLVEQAFQLEVNGIPYSGILDWYDKRFRLWDLKTAGSRPSKGRDRYRFNTIGYALGARDVTGAEETGTGLAFIVKTKTPYYWPVESPTVTDDDIDLFAARLEAVAESVERSIWEPDGLFKRGICKTCPFTANCGPYIRLQETL